MKEGPAAQPVIHAPADPPPAPGPVVPGLPREPRRWVIEVAQSILLALLLFAVINAFVAQPVEVELTSMRPTLEPGDHLLVDKLTPRWAPYDRGDVVVFDAPTPFDADGIPYVKRIVGLPGETVMIENGAIFIAAPKGAPVRLDEPYLDGGGPTLPRGASGDTTWRVPADAVFVLGDNRAGSVDSRTFGTIGLERIIGRAWLRYLPIDRITLMETTRAP
jgi:signal peptidase I